MLSEKSEAISMRFDNIANNAAHKQLPERRDYQRDDSASVISSVNPEKLFFFQMGDTVQTNRILIRCWNN